MSEEPKHTYPSNYPPGKHWALDWAWQILDTIKPGVIPDDARAYLAGQMTGAFELVARGERKPRR
jgi:hypothetical protein